MDVAIKEQYDRSCGDENILYLHYINVNILDVI